MVHHDRQGSGQEFSCAIPPRKGTLEGGGGGGAVCCHCLSGCSGGAQGTLDARNVPSGLVRDGKRSEP